VATLRAAITRIGGKGACNLLIAVSISKVFIPRDAWERSLWRHALQVAIASRKLTERCDGYADPDEVYVCGLLHDVGRFVMFQEAPEQLRRIDEGDWETPEALVELERSICGLTHAELGGLACDKWGLPRSIVRMVREHHAKARSADPLDEPTMIVRFADFALFPSAMPGTPGLAEADEEKIDQVLRPKLPSFVRLSKHELANLIKSATADADSTSRSLGII
jgi:putative nucleotidyltransferase with HDIG domain